MDPPGVIGNGKVFKGGRGKRAEVGDVRTILRVLRATLNSCNV